MTTTIGSALLILMTLAACGPDKGTEGNGSREVQTSTDHNTAAAPITETVPAFLLEDMSGKQVSLQSFAGKKLFVNIWASWCPPCRREMPSIQKLYRSVDTSKVAFVMISLDENFDKAKTYISRQKLDLPVFYPAQNLPDLFNVQGIPATFIFNEDGILVQRIEGSDDYDTKRYRNLLK